MVVRLALFSAIATALLAYQHGFHPWSVDPERLLWPVWSYPALAALGLLAGIAARDQATRRHHLWLSWWLVLVGALWLGPTIQGAIDASDGLTGFGPLALRLLYPFVLTSSLLLGYLFLIERRAAAKSAEAAALIQGLPFVLAALLISNPAVRGSQDLILLPILSAAGFLPWKASWLASDTESPFIDALTATGEMVAKQGVAWGLALSTVGAVAELLRDGFWAALITLSGVGVGAWLGSGLVWGLAQKVREGRGRRWTVAVLRLLFGRRAVGR